MTSGPLSAPWTAIGRLQSDVTRLERQINMKAESHEITQANNMLDATLCELREIRAEIIGLLDRMQELENNQKTAF